MLAEMGVRVWLPSEVAAAPKNNASAPERAQLEAVSSVAIPVRKEPPLRLPVLEHPPAQTTGAPVQYMIGNMPSEEAVFDCIVLGEPCAGDAEKLLANMTRLLGSKIWIAQMVAAPSDAPLLVEQLSHMSSKVILALGSHVSKALLGEACTDIPFGKLRGQAHSVKGIGGKIVVTYHPQQLLKKPIVKAQTWLDLKLALKEK